MKQHLLIMVLAVGTAATAVAVIYGKYHSRMLFHQAQSLEQQLDRLAVEWEQLLIEEHAWADPARIEHLARSQLGMVVPRADEITYLTVK
ncbi:MAG TPA: cell division protein FtsL [Methylothermaceae bacterium]|nr:cell division protein FtsL [Methylothermaceae bacterium]